MPVEIHISPDGKKVEFISSGTVTGAEILDANRSIYTPETLRKLAYKIVDRTTCTDYQVSAEEVQLIANQDKEAAKINPDLQILLVAPTDLQFGVSRMWQAYVGETGLQTKIFRDRESAYAWLQVHRDDPPPG